MGGAFSTATTQLQPVVQRLSQTAIDTLAISYIEECVVYDQDAHVPVSTLGASLMAWLKSQRNVIIDTESGDEFRVLKSVLDLMRESGAQTYQFGPLYGRYSIVDDAIIAGATVKFPRDKSDYLVEFSVDRSIGNGDPRSSFRIGDAP